MRAETLKDRSRRPADGAAGGGFRQKTRTRGSLAGRRRYLVLCRSGERVAVAPTTNCRGASWTIRATRESRRTASRRPSRPNSSECCSSSGRRRSLAAIVATKPDASGRRGLLLHRSADVVAAAAARSDDVPAAGKNQLSAPKTPSDSSVSNLPRARESQTCRKERLDCRHPARSPCSEVVEEEVVLQATTESRRAGQPSCDSRSRTGPAIRAALLAFRPASTARRLRPAAATLRTPPASVERRCVGAAVVAAAAAETRSSR